jgi:hypothetical protein
VISPINFLINLFIATVFNEVYCSKFTEVCDFHGNRYSCRLSHREGGDNSSSETSMDLAISMLCDVGKFLTT